MIHHSVTKETLTSSKESTTSTKYQISTVNGSTKRSLHSNILSKDFLPTSKLIWMDWILARVIICKPIILSSTYMRIFPSITNMNRMSILLSGKIKISWKITAFCQVTAYPKIMGICSEINCNCLTNPRRVLVTFWKFPRPTTRTCSIIKTT